METKFRTRITVYGSAIPPVRVKPRIYDALMEIAACRGENISNVVRTALNEEIKRFRKEEKKNEQE